MKKLMPMIAAVIGALSTFAAVGEKDTFEGYTVGDHLTDTNYWAVSQDAEAVIAEADSKYLNIEDSPNTDPIKRFINDRDYDPISEKWSAPEEMAIPDKGLYLDTKVQFTASDTLDLELAADAKIAVFAYTNDVEGGSVKLVAKAGYYEGSNLVTSNYVFNADIDLSAWYRLTVKAIPIASDKYGFVVYLNGDKNALTYIGDAGNIGDLNLNAIAQKYYPTVGAKSLLPSRVQRGDNKGNLTSVGFAGTGKLDDVDFTNEAPPFAKDDLMVTFKWDSGVASVTTNEAPFDISSGTEAVATFPAGAAPISVAAVAKSGYAFTSWTDRDVDPNKVKEVDLTTFEVACKIGNKNYASLDEAVSDETAQGTIELVNSVSIGSDKYVEVKKNLVIDLAGRTITANGQYAFVVTAGSLTITNSTESIGTITGGSEATIYNYRGAASAVVVYGGKIDGTIDENATCFGGVFKGTAVKFPYDLGSEDLEANYADGYWTVTPKAPEVVKPFAIIIADVTNKYETLDVAIAAAEAGQTITLLEDASLASGTLVEKNVTIDLNGNTLTYTESTDGIYFKGTQKNVLNCTVKNGTIVMAGAATTEWVGAITFEDAGGLVKDVTVNAGEAKYGVVTCCDDDSDTCDATVVCENVDVTGKGLLFYCESEKMTLDADCTATKTGNSSYGADYDNAVAASWLGELTITGGVYTAAIGSGNVLGTMISPATITITGGDFDGTFHFMENQHPELAEASVIEITGGTFTTDPSDYVASGYAATLDPETGKYSVAQSATAVAKIGEKGYPTLAAAFAAVADGQTIQLLDNVELTEALAVNVGNVAGEGITLDLGTFKLTTTAAMTIANTKMTIANGEVTVPTASGLVLKTNSDVTLAADGVIRPTATYAFEVEDATFNVYGTCTANVQVPIHAKVDGGEINIYDGAVVENTNPNFDAIRINGGETEDCTVTLNVYGGTISGAYSVYAYKAHNKSVINIEGGVFNDILVIRKDSQVTVTPLDDTCTAKFKVVGKHESMDNYLISELCADGYAPKKITEGDYKDYYQIARQYKVLFKVADDNITTNLVWAGDTTTAPAAPAVEGKVFKGWKCGEQTVAAGAEITPDADMTFVAQLADAGFAVILAGETKGSYETLAAAVEAAAAGDTVKVLADNATNADSITISKAITLDLGGKTLTSTTTLTTSADVTVTNGTFVYNAKGGYAVNIKGGKFTVAVDAKITYGENKTSANEFVVLNAGTIDVYGTIDADYVSCFAIAVRPTDAVAAAGIEINCYDGCFVKSYANAIKYNGKDNNEWGGKINIFGGTLSSNGAGTYTPIYLNKTKNVTVVKITGGTFLSGEGTDVGDGIVRTEDADTTKANFVKLDGDCKAKFNSKKGAWDKDGKMLVIPLAELCAEGYGPVLGEDGYYTIQKVYDITITPPENGTLDTSVTNNIAAGTTVTVTATPESGYELESITTNGTAITGNTFVMPAENVTVAATFAKAGPVYPPTWPEAEEYTEAFGTWAGKYDMTGVDLTTDAAKNAFLMNVDPNGELPELKIESIAVADGVATIVVSAAGVNLETGINGKLFVSGCNALGGAWTTTDVELPKSFNDGKATFTVDAAKFMKAKVDFKVEQVK